MTAPALSILQVLHDYLPVHTGGSEIHAHQLARAMQARGHRVTCLFTERDIARREGEITEGRHDGVRTLERVHQREYADVRETWSDPRAEHDFASVLDRERPDVVHFHHLAQWGPACLSIARDHGARVVMTVHDYHALCDRATLLTPAGEICERGVREACGACLERHPLLEEDPAHAARGPTDRAAMYAARAHERRECVARHFGAVSRFLAPSRFLAKLLADSGLVRAESLEVMPYGHSGRVFAPRSEVTRRPLRVGFVGGLYFEKGAHVLIDALRHLAARDPLGSSVEAHVHGVLTWFPDYVARLRQSAQGLPVQFHGGFDPGDVDRVYASIDLLCVPSLWYENHPLTIQDAFRHGVPVIATNLGGMSELVVDGVSGLCFPRGDARALAAAIERILVEPELYSRLAQNRREVSSIAEIAARIEVVYLEGTSVDAR